MIPFGKGWKGWIRDGFLVRVEGSLTRYNDGRLPETEDELNDALKAVSADIAALAKVDDLCVYRLDLARDVAEPTAPLVRACRQFRFPGIRKAAEVADDDVSIRWGNGRTTFQVCLYDAAKQHRRPSPSSRLEIRLRSKAIAKRGLQRETSWARLAEVFDGFVRHLPAAASAPPTGRLGPGQIIARLGKSFGKQVEQELYQLMSQGRSRPTTRKMRKQMNEALSLDCGKSPQQAFTLPRVINGKKLSTVLPSGE